MRFSNRKLKGLPVPKEIIVRDLASYIRLFSDGKYKNYFFRGEPTNYNETVSSALRGEEKNSFIKMRNEFKKEVWHKLTSDERTYFTAFSQHHGIPTNLIDITTSPLIALFFACGDFKNRADENHDEQRGFVYLFEDNFVDITNLLAKIEDGNLLEFYAYNKDNIFVDMYKIFLEFEQKKPFQFYNYIKKLNIDYHIYFGWKHKKNLIPRRFIPFDNGQYKREVYKYIYEIIGDNEEYKNFLRDIEKGLYEESYSVLFYTLYLQRFLRNILEFKEPIFWFNIMPNFKYAPILPFERGRNQQGLFIYQTYLNFVEQVYNAEILVQQKIWPDKIIVIENKKLIHDELDFIGINEKFIYEDFDNIASYIKKHM